LSVDTVFRVMAGAAVVGTGRVLPQAPGQRHDGPDRRLQS
jgi:hypothetical protein